MTDKILLIGSDFMISQVERHCLEKGLNVTLFNSGISVLEADLIEFANSSGLSINDLVNRIKEANLILKDPEIIFPVSDYAIPQAIEKTYYRENEFKPNFSSHLHKGGKKNKSTYHNQHKFRRR